MRIRDARSALSWKLETGDWKLETGRTGSNMPRATDARARLRRESVRRRSRPRADAERPRGDGGRRPALAVGRADPDAGTGTRHPDPAVPLCGERFLWELPAGSVDEGEQPEQAARRECHEEIGQVPAHDRPARARSIRRQATATRRWCSSGCPGLDEPTEAAAAGRRRRHRGADLRAARCARDDPPRRDHRHEDGGGTGDDLIARSAVANRLIASYVARVSPNLLDRSASRCATAPTTACSAMARTSSMCAT